MFFLLRHWLGYLCFCISLILHASSIKVWSKMFPYSSFLTFTPLSFAFQIWTFHFSVGDMFLFFSPCSPVQHCQSCTAWIRSCQAEHSALEVWCQALFKRDCKTSLCRPWRYETCSPVSLLLCSCSKLCSPLRLLRQFHCFVVFSGVSHRFGWCFAFIADHDCMLGSWPLKWFGAGAIWGSIWKMIPYLSLHIGLSITVLLRFIHPALSRGITSALFFIPFRSGNKLA